jgi:GGDEF domain-containing protein
MLNVSIGVAGYPWGGENADEMMQWADADMYANKISSKLPQDAVASSQEKLPDDSALGEFDRV